jgi:hypothetical protein
MFRLPQFKFKHVFYKLNDDFFNQVGETVENAEEAGDELEEKYQELLENLNYFEDVE